MAEEDSGGSVGFREVRERFAESTDALTEAKAKLDALGTQAEAQEVLNSSLKGSVDALTAFTDKARDAVEGLANAQDEAKKAFESMSKVADGTDIKAIREGVLQIQEKLDRIDALEAELADVKGKLMRLGTAAGGRALKKAGLEPADISG
jgi:hypothetical protein